MTMFSSEDMQKIEQGIGNSIGNTTSNRPRFTLGNTLPITTNGSFPDTSPYYVFQKFNRKKDAMFGENRSIKSILTSLPTFMKDREVFWFAKRGPVEDNPRLYYYPDLLLRVDLTENASRLLTVIHISGLTEDGKFSSVIHGGLELQGSNKYVLYIDANRVKPYDGDLEYYNTVDDLWRIILTEEGTPQQYIRETGKSFDIDEKGWNLIEGLTIKYQAKTKNKTEGEDHD